MRKRRRAASIPRVASLMETEEVKSALWVNCRADGQNQWTEGKLCSLLTKEKTHHWLSVTVLICNTLASGSCPQSEYCWFNIMSAAAADESRGNKWTVLLFSSAVPSCWSTDRLWCLNTLCFYSKQSINPRFSYLNCPSFDSFSFSRAASCNMSEFQTLWKWILPEGKKRKHLPSTVFSDKDNMYFHTLTDN